MFYLLAVQISCLCVKGKGVRQTFFTSLLKQTIPIWEQRKWVMSGGKSDFLLKINKKTMQVNTIYYTIYHANQLVSGSLLLLSHVLLNPQQQHNPTNVQTSLPYGKSASKIQMSQGILKQQLKHIQNNEFFIFTAVRTSNFTNFIHYQQHLVCDASKLLQ